MRMRVLDHPTLLALNEKSIQAGRNQYLGPGKLPAQPQERYWINVHTARQRDGQQEVRICVVMDLNSGRAAWLDVSAEEFAAIPEVDVPEAEWETAMCAGTPPQAP